MLSRRVDLTENNDFSSRDLSDFLINVDIVNDVVNHNSQIMSTDMFDKIQKYEKVFGRTYHHNEVNDVFFNDERFYRENRDVCQRCGKTIRVPWKNFTNFCEVCDSIIDNELSYMDSKIPWKALSLANMRDTTRELFSIR